MKKIKRIIYNYLVTYFMIVPIATVLTIMFIFINMPKLTYSFVIGDESAFLFKPDVYFKLLTETVTYSGALPLLLVSDWLLDNDEEL